MFRNAKQESAEVDGCRGVSWVCWGVLGCVWGSGGTVVRGVLVSYSALVCLYSGVTPQINDLCGERK